MTQFNILVQTSFYQRFQNRTIFFSLKRILSQLENVFVLIPINRRVNLPTFYLSSSFLFFLTICLVIATVAVGVRQFAKFPDNLSRL